MKNTLSSIGSIYLSLLGLAMIIFSQKIGKVAKFWNLRLWGFSTGERQYQIAFILGGVIFMVMGCLAFLGIIKFRT
jgi:hypothetical protein